MDLLVGLIALAAVVSVIAVVGHVIWLLASEILRFLFQTGRQPSRPASPCPRCGNPRGLTHGVCDRCGHDSARVKRRALESAMRQVERLHREGRLDTAVFNHAIEALSAAKRQLPQTADTAAAPPRLRPAAGPSAGPFAPATTSPAVEVGREAAAVAFEPVEAELVTDDDQASPVTPAAAVPTAAPMPAPPDFARDTEPAVTRFSPRRTLADMLQSFMDEKNIQWGELASGMLIVGSAIGLVISLRATLVEISERVRYFPALLFMLGTMAVHAAGLYTLRRWKLRRTSRGVLIIGMLLVPLSFVAGIVLSGPDDARLPAIGPMYIAAVTVGLLGYGAITSLSARALLVADWWRLIVAVMGSAAGQLVINRQVEFEGRGSLMVRATALFAVPLASFLAATLTQLQQVARKTRLSRARANQTFLVLGIAAFALTVPLGLLIYRAGEVHQMLAALSPSWSLVAAVVLGVGIAVHGRCESPTAASTRTIGTALAAFGGLLMIGADVLAWPTPHVLITVCALTAMALVVLAAIGRVAGLHAGAAVAGTIGYLLLVLRLGGSLEAHPTSAELIQAVIMGRSAWALMAAAVTIAGLAGWSVRARRSPIARVYLGTAGGLAAVSGAIGLYAGFWSGVDSAWMTPLFAIGALGCLVIGHRLEVTGQGRAREAEAETREGPNSGRQSGSWSVQPPALLTWCGSAMLLVALLHLLAWNGWFAEQLAVRRLTVSSPWRLALISHALLATALAGATWLRNRATGGALASFDAEGDPRQRWLAPLAWSGSISAAVAVPPLIHVTPHSVNAQAAYAVAIAAAWAMAGLARQVPRLLSASHVAATVAVGFLVAAVAARQPWPEPRWLDLRHAQWQLIALGLWCAATTVACIRARRSVTARALLREISPALDRVLLGALLLALVGLGVVGCWPGILVELGFARPDLAGIRGFGFAPASGAGGWWAWASVALALGAAVAQGMNRTGWIAIVAWTAVAPLLISGSWETGRAVASGLRWTFAGYTLCWAVLAAMRGLLVAGLKRLSPAAHGRWASLDSPMRDAAVIVGSLPVFGLTLLALSQVISGAPWGGPSAETWFTRLTPAVSYVVPLAILTSAMLVLAVREGISAYALMGSIFCACAIALGVALQAASSGTGWTTSWSVTLAQALALGLAGYGLVWQLLSRWIERRVARPDASWLRIQVLLSIAAVAGLSSWALGALLVSPSGDLPELGLLGRWPSHAAAALWAACVAWGVRGDARRLAASAVGLPVVWAPLAAATACTFAPALPWVGYHVVTGVWLAVGLGAACCAWWGGPVVSRPRWISVYRASGALLGLAVFVLAIRGSASDPIGQWWTPAICGGLSLLWAIWAIGGRVQWGAYGSVVSVLWGTWAIWSELAARRGPGFVTGGVYTLIIAGTATAAFWLLVEIWYQDKRDASLDPRVPNALRVHSFLAVVMTALMGLFALGSALAWGGRNPGLGIANLTTTDALRVTALAGLSPLLLAMLWDRHSRAVLLMLDIWGLIVIVMGLDLFNRTTDFGVARTVMAACLAGACHIALTGHLWRWGANLATWAVRLHMPDPVARLERASRWLLVLNVLGTLSICGLGFVTIFIAKERGERMGTAFAPVLLAYGMGCLAQRPRRLVMQCFSLLVLSLAAVYIGWADVRPAPEYDPVLMYAARHLISVAGATLLYAVVVARWIGPRSSWWDAVRRTSLILAAATISALAVVLALEVAHFTPGARAPIATPEVIAISVMLAGFVVALLSMALWPGKDPLNLTEKGRTAYVYAAQLMAALLFAHVYLVENQLFHGRFRDHWPYIVMLLAFGSAAFGELCVRRNWRVIAEPLLRTGGFLPLLPAVAAWAFSDTRYPLVLFSAGLVYVFLSITRRSFYTAVAAAVTSNGAIWALLSEKGLEFFIQPQMWLIPPALSVLIAAHVNRARLTEHALTGIRYGCVIIIYLSSAGEMFMKLVVSDAPEAWLRPIVLASLAVAGMLAGILLRVRAFLYLGASFLLLSIVAMVWNAGRLVQHTWPWWAFGISMGLAILVLFGVFEKHRQAVQGLIARLRQWDA